MSDAINIESYKGVEVKLLEWQEFAERGRGAYADTIFGRYVVWDFDGKDGYYKMLWASNRWVEGGIDDAKAAAQADYEARIRSALTSPASGVAHATACISMDCDLCKGSGLTNQGHNCSRCGGSGVRRRARRAHIMSDAIDPYAVTEVMAELVGDQVVLVLTVNDEGLSAILDIHYATLLRDKLDVAIRAMLAKVKP